VKFLLARDADGSRFRFAPLQGETFLARTTEAQRTRLPDSVVILTREGLLLTRSAATIYAMRCLGGVWRALASIGALLPRRLLDALYDFVARFRYQVFGRTFSVCPVVPENHRERFLP
jgi:predicted DCC family thiol-disulfide oxidoreductase YuxK